MPPQVSTWPLTLDLKVYAGDRNLIPLKFTSGGAPWDITGATLQAQSRMVDTDVAAAVTAECVVVDPENGLAEMSWDGEEVRGVMDGQSTWTGVWDLQIIELGQTLPRTVLRGKWTASMDVTRT